MEGLRLLLTLNSSCNVLSLLVGGPSFHCENLNEAFFLGRAPSFHVRTSVRKARHLFCGRVLIYTMLLYAQGELKQVTEEFRPIASSVSGDWGLIKPGKSLY